MSSVIDPILLQQTERFTKNAGELKNLINELSKSADDNAIDRVIELYKKNILQLEQNIWQKKTAHKKQIKQYQNAFKVLEQLYKLRSSDDRYNFKIIIPVADRPQQLKQCLNSLLTLCQLYEYGGYARDKYSRISVLIADDSSNNKNIKLHRNYCHEFSKAGLATEYFGLSEQLDLVRSISSKNTDLSRILPATENIKDAIKFSHKGASIMRNITYLKLIQNLSAEDISNTLIYFIDSDQEFCINSDHTQKNLYAVNYFHYLNEIFKMRDVSVVTGKVVGDPPVSPSVMAGNFQQDIKNFLQVIKDYNDDNSCQFHQHAAADHNDDAAYHDMADLFGFSNQGKVYNYQCTLKGKHNNLDCFYDFSTRLQHFFYGEHPTRKTYFNYDNGFDTTAAARTVYTGNYVIKAEMLAYFIPFATLKLRMAGPVLGRILKTRLQHKFVCANLPMLHNRTYSNSGQSEFRAGVNSHHEEIDLGNEFIRQFYGDVMLFTMEKITNEGFPDKDIADDKLESVLNTTYKTIKISYVEKHDSIMQLKHQINELLNNPDYWWNKTASQAKKISSAKSNISDFLKNIQLNFSDSSYAYKEIMSAEKSQIQLQNIFNAIKHYQHDMENWNKTPGLQFKR